MRLAPRMSDWVSERQSDRHVIIRRLVHTTLWPKIKWVTHPHTRHHPSMVTDRPNWRSRGRTRRRTNKGNSDWCLADEVTAKVSSGVADH